jgi:predicted aldo/keto reductase-like oxidoreductase
MKGTLGRRAFLKGAALAAAMPAGMASAASKADRPGGRAGAIPARPFGKTGRTLPILGYGGAALPKKWGNALSTEDRVKLVRRAYDTGIRYFDTAISTTYGESQAIIGKALKEARDEVFITTKVDFWDTSRPDGRITKVDKAEVGRQVEKNLAELQSDYIDAILIHGTPGVEQMTVEQCMEVHGELVKARNKGLVRFIGFSAHSYFDKALALIESGGFDLCMLAYGYFPRGHSQVFTARMTELRNACVAEAHARGMGIAAMKVIGGGVLGAWAPYVVPGFDKERLARLPGAAIRWALQDERIDLLVIGMRLEDELDANLRTLAGDLAFTLRDRALLAGFMARAYDSDAIRKMRVD